MKFEVNALLSADHFNLCQSTAVVTVEYYRNNKKDLEVNYAQVIIYGKKNKKLKQEFGGVCFVNTPMDLFKRANHRVIWVLCKELFFHLNRWINTIYTDDEEIDCYMKHDREQRSGLFAKYGWARLPHFKCIEEYYNKSSSSLSRQEKEKVYQRVNEMLVKSCNPETKRVLKGLATHISVSVHRTNGKRKYTVKLMEYPMIKVKAVCRFETDNQEKTHNLSLEIVYNERSLT